MSERGEKTGSKGGGSGEEVSETKSERKGWERVGREGMCCRGEISCSPTSPFPPSAPFPRCMTDGARGNIRILGRGINVEVKI